MYLQEASTAVAMTRSTVTRYTATQNRNVCGSYRSLPLTTLHMSLHYTCHYISHVFTGSKHSSGYDPQHRNPLYCHAEQECVWELQKLASHYHPTVSLFANRLLKVCHIQTWFLCRLRSIATHRDHFVHRPSVCPSVTLFCHTFQSYVLQATHAFLGMLPLYSLLWSRIPLSRMSISTQILSGLLFP